jgi:hypothetical protein
MGLLVSREALIGRVAPSRGGMLALTLASSLLSEGRSAMARDPFQIHGCRTMLYQPSE